MRIKNFIWDIIVNLVLIVYNIYFVVGWCLRIMYEKAKRCIAE